MKLKIKFPAIVAEVVIGLILVACVPEAVEEGVNETEVVTREEEVQGEITVEENTAVPELIEPDLAQELTVIYALPDTGIAYLLTPRREPIEITSEELSQNPSALENQVLGTLTVVQSLRDELPVDTYNIILDPSGESVVYVGTTISAQFQAVIRTLPLPIPEERPIAMISSEQMCLAWNTLQICALVSTPLRDDLSRRIEEAIGNLGVDPNLFAIDRAIPDVEGDNFVAICTEQLSQEAPSYSECNASVLTAPVEIADALPSLPGDPDAIETGLLIVLEDLVLSNDAYSDRELTEPIEELNAGTYLMYDIILPEDSIIGEYDNQQISLSRVGLSSQVGADPDLYLHAVIGAPLVGEAPGGAPPDTRPEAVISNLWVKGWDGKWRCYFRWRQCPWLQ